MQKITLIVLLLAISNLALAQPAFQRKDVFVNAGLSVGNYRHTNYSSSERYGGSIPLNASIEYGLINCFGVGPFAGYYSRRYKYVGPSAEDTQDDFTYRSRYTVVGLRATYHFTCFLEEKLKADLTSEDLDLYVSGLLGYEFNSLSNLNDIDIEGKSKPVIGAVFGARYFVSYRFAFFGEVGPGILGLGSFGVTARF